ncbi:uncharacterized protein LOC129913619 [Episyrphus balteatus]|uniref:uncharacterized protein LOC129913619 n=1 Tax=Episyrphus balteatus TaxID=286459 RepID=UPI002485E152|nr:uncharacterized protein LOC129913619 [Episyrphus balteatus]
MKTCFLIFTTLLVLTEAGRVSEEFLQRNHLSIALQKSKNNGLAIEGRSLSSSGKNALENFVSKFPCGWPEAGIPPLAPYTKDEFVFELKKAFAEIFAKIENFRIDGLDELLINKLKINYTFSQKVKFDVLFPKIVISGKLLSGALIDLMKDYGLRIEYINQGGDFEMILENIRFQGEFKYTMPFIFGSISIYRFAGSITLGNVITQFNGIFGKGKLKQLLEEQIEDIIVKAVNLNQNGISAKFEDDLIPFLNGKLKGYKVWSVIGAAFGKSDVCIPPDDRAENEV